MNEEARRRRWRELVEEHREALAEFVATAEALSEEAWGAPRAPGKWSPGQIAEHLRLTCETMHAEIERRGGFRVRTGWLRQRLLRLVLVPRILRSGRFPEGAPAVREIRPDAAVTPDRPGTLAGLRERADALTRGLAATDPGQVGAVSHPFFGRLDPLQGLALATVHVRHHHRQIREAAERGRASAPAPRPAATTP